MSYSHSNVYIVKIDDTTADGEPNTWYVGPYGSTLADQTADHLESTAERPRTCTVLPLFSDDECLVIGDYGRATQRSLY